MTDIAQREADTLSQWAISAFGMVHHPPDGRYQPSGGFIPPPDARLRSSGGFTTLFKRGVKGSQTGPISVSVEELWPAPDTATCSAAVGSMSQIP
ncbi:hypothetical protein PCANC_13453 [Puccinia coronata f. sp. avenae]|uniref:Uncharacterized protein n=1 Tax=Puccinia coronata f. sp. avenae TaxID=200324 RepID=A0A2N5SRA5_9BASI|nr:hypothetical protein PCANC_13453 [Puccinia coronata f. sp. avenae]